jgi:tetratricopeptide (TPR) repeat protein
MDVGQGRPRNLSFSYRKIGEVLEDQGKLAEALDFYRQSLKIEQTLADQDKTNAEWQWELAVGYSRISEVLEDQGKLAEALDACQQSWRLLSV